MIFNEYSTTQSVIPSTHEMGIEGALVSVYENECNYNALIKAVGISEYRYYQETGMDLFVHEAGAFSKFIDKAKAFFKTVGEKIASLFNKLKSWISSKLSDDKKFVQKYGAAIKAKKLGSDFEFEGYGFEKLSSALNAGYDVKSIKLIRDDEDPTNVSPSSDIADNESKTNRGKLYTDLTGESVGELETSDFVKKLKESLIGTEKKKITIDANAILGEIETAKKDIKDAQNAEKSAQAAIKAILVQLDAWAKQIDKKAEGKDTLIKNVNKNIKIFKDYSQDITKASGVIVEALKKRRAQNKAACIKIISYKSTDSVGEAYNLFANVVIN